MNFIFQFGEFTAADGGFLKTFIPLAAPLVALYIYYTGQKKATNKEAKSKVDTENNKLKYLHYLVDDSLRPIETFSFETDKLQSMYHHNFFVLPPFNRIIPHSMNTISNKINQEEYYLASKNRIDEDISELFKVYNSLYDNFIKSVAHYDENRPLLVKDKGAYNEALNKLVKLYTDKTNELMVGATTHAEAVVLNKLQSLSDVIPDEENRRWNMSWMLNAHNSFIKPLIHILSNSPDSNTEDLLQKSKEVKELYTDFRSFVFNVVDSLKISKDHQKGMVDIIVERRKPLDAYIIKLNEVDGSATKISTVDRMLGFVGLQRKPGI
ncbi:hypothetical protein [Spirosoma aerophilum]